LADQQAEGVKMLYLLTKALISGVLIAIASEVAKRSPGFGALIVSLPLVSLLAFIWLWLDSGDKEAVASLSQSTFWFVLPSLPLLLVLPALLRNGVSFWPALGMCCALTVALYFLMVWALGRLGVQL
jgi:hypothetical protein